MDDEENIRLAIYSASIYKKLYNITLMQGIVVLSSKLNLDSIFSPEVYQIKQNIFLILAGRRVLKLTQKSKYLRDVYQIWNIEDGVEFKRRINF